MKPPICEICIKHLNEDCLGESGLVWFKDYQDLPPGMVGHPKGLGWFCGQHFKSAQSLNNLSKADAVRQLKRNYGKGSSSSLS